MGRPCCETAEHQMGISTHNVVPPPGTETSRQTWNQMGRRLQESSRSTLDQDRREPYEWRDLGDTSNTRARNHQYHPATSDVQQRQAVNQWGVSCINTRASDHQYHPATSDVQQKQAVNQWRVSCINTEHSAPIKQPCMRIRWAVPRKRRP